MAKGASSRAMARNGDGIEGSEVPHDVPLNLGRCLATLARVAGSGLDKIRRTAECALKLPPEEAPRSTRSSEKDIALREVVEMTIKFQREALLANVPSFLSSLPDSSLTDSQSLHHAASGEVSGRCGDDKTPGTRQLASLIKENKTLKAQLADAEERSIALQEKIKYIARRYENLLQPPPLSQEVSSVELSPRGCASKSSNVLGCEQASCTAQGQHDSKSTWGRRRIPKVHFAPDASTASSRQKICNADYNTDNGMAISDGPRHSSGTDCSDLVGILQQENVLLRRRIEKLSGEQQCGWYSTADSHILTADQVESMTEKITRLRRELLTEGQRREDALLLLSEVKRDNRRLALELGKLKKQIKEDSCGDERIMVKNLESGSVAELLEEELRLVEHDATLQELQVRQLFRVIGKLQDFLRVRSLKQKELLTDLHNTSNALQVADRPLNVACGSAKEKEKYSSAAGGRGGAVADGSSGGTAGKSPHCTARSADGVGSGATRRSRSACTRPAGESNRKGDVVDNLQSENAELVKENEQLHRALSNLSIMSQFAPRGEVDVEQLRVERDVFLSELRRCEQFANVPNMKKILKKVQIRKSELKSWQKESERRRERQLLSESVMRPNLSGVDGGRKEPARSKADAVVEDIDTESVTPHLAHSRIRKKPSGSTALTQSSVDRSYSFDSNSTTMFLRRLAEFRFPIQNPSGLLVDIKSANLDGGPLHKEKSHSHRGFVKDSPVVTAFTHKREAHSAR
ncbi:hypothetical protein ERJ75_001237500 [Trypanosoma vivax]|uniref:Uncharacterized protein n=1 Tax=Trypanosoma vivax (strain Y486) TaxID=1055687 RepID=G0U0P4_TRYVY|nr:hypothetical protein ERJ75_001237500 [Trypanosoma vivax]CCC49643.1 conserved hypothetical protein [Trypanosoma vivax Y486]